MLLREIGPMLARHRRWWLWPWRCRCGMAYPCGARVVALDELVRHRSRETGQWYLEYFARQRAAEAAQARRRSS